jgi:uncharacterized protein
MLRFDVSDLEDEIEVEFDEGPEDLGFQDELRFADRIKGRVRISRISGGIEAVGEVTTAVYLECARCLETFRYPLRTSFDVIFRRGSEPIQWQEEIALNDEDMKTSFFQGDFIDVGEEIRQDIIVSIPIKPLCKESCRGLCPRCGGRIDKGECKCPKEEKDSPFAVLKEIFSEKEGIEHGKS